MPIAAARRPTSQALAFALAAFASCVGACESCNSAAAPAPTPLGSVGARGEALTVGTVVAATEKTGGVRLYKIKEVLFFPPPMSDELVMLAYDPKAESFDEAARMWREGRAGLTVALPTVRVARHLFIVRDQRIVGVEDVTAAELSAKVESVKPLPLGRP